MGSSSLLGKSHIPKIGKITFVIGAFECDPSFQSNHRFQTHELSFVSEVNGSDRGTECHPDSNIVPTYFFFK
jgi:hypothetical protein